MSNKWTDEQSYAIDARGMQVLVSAAAGSGKTSVLTERVKNILCDVEKPCSVSEILVVTFTRAAAGEMKDRIYKALKSASDETTDSDYLRHQMVLLPTADICTIDSFCSKIVRDNFNRAGVSLDFTLLDEKELNEITNDALEIVINKLYDENDPSFIELTSMFLNEKDDGKLSDIIYDLYKYSRAYPSSDIYLKHIEESFDENKEPNDTIWADYIYKYVGSLADFHCKRLNRCVAILEDSGKFSPDYFLRFTETAKNLQNLKNAVDMRSWDGMVSIINEGIVVMPKATNRGVDAYVKTLTSDAFSDARADIEGLCELTLPTSDEHKLDSMKLRPVVAKLCEAVRMLTSTMDEMKKERNGYGFDDILHKCIDLLVEFKDGNWVRTSVAEELKNRYKEILIDEYQDTNQAQNMIFEAISKDSENLFCVGDVKQSIYKFRLASPELFVELKKRLTDYDGSRKPSLINLDRNFRSRKGITEVTNHVFTSLMSEEVGDIDYNDKEKLVCGADYPDKNTPDVEILCLDYSDLYSSDAMEQEAREVARYIKRLLNSGITVKTKNGTKPLEYSDICVLFRNGKKRVDLYSQALKEEGIPSNAVLDGNISDSKEINLLASLVKVVSNPLMDVSLVSVLFSPLFGFTPDELSEIRMIDRYSDLYPCLEKYAEKSHKARRFMNKLQLYRNISASYPVNEFVHFVVRDTGIENIYSACADGEHRKANIRGFLKFADDFTGSGRSGLSKFIRSMDSAISSGKLSSYAGVTTPEGVQFMTIHKSKGLEFPYVIVADTASDFNKLDSRKQLKIARETGVGLKIRDDEQFTSYNTVSSVATEKEILFGGASEELRVMYVALTRAKEHVTFVCSLRKMSGTAKRVRMNNYLSFNSENKLHPFAVYRAKNMCEWLLSCFCGHADCKIVCDLCDVQTPYTYLNHYSVDVSSNTPDVSIEMVENDTKEKSSVDIDLLKSIEDKINYTYAYDCSGLLAKITASSTENVKNKREYFGKRKPTFIGDGFTGADRGNAIHKFFEVCDFSIASSDFEKEKARLLENGIMSDEELSVINPDAVSAFFESGLGKRILNSRKVFKEYEFSFLKSAKDVYDHIPDRIADEEIVVQGKLDLAFVEGDKAILIDYKSDSITDENVFVDIYRPQIDVYSEALSKCTGYAVEERYLYSFKLKKFIKL